MKTITAMRSLPVLMFFIMVIAFSGNAGTIIKQGEVADKLKPDTVQKVCPLLAVDFARKGKFYFYWGYNFAWYTNSDIHFTGSDYDFTIYDVESTHEPAKKFTTYVNPTMFTVPQHNWRIGYYFNDRHSVSFGNDHMKYVMPNQYVMMTGTISSGDNAGTYDKRIIIVGELDGHDHEGGGSGSDGHSHSHGEDTLHASGIVSTYEHCDGLNDFSVEYGWTGNLWASKNGKHALAVTGTFSVGGLVPDSEANVLGAKDPSHGTEAHTIAGLHPEHNANQKNKGYHLAGFSTSAGLGVQVNFFKNLFLLARVKGGYINMPDIITTHEGGRAKQSFGYIEPMLVVGYSFSIRKK